jgi:hypothetical protein
VWTGINAASGIVAINDDIYFISRSSYGKVQDFEYAVASVMQQQRDAGELCYADHNNYIDMQYKFAWEHLKNPSTFKKYLRAKIISSLSRLTSQMRFALKSYFDFSETTIRTNVTVTFTTELEKNVKLLNDKALSQEITLESQRYYEPVVITGLDVEVSTPFRGLK